MKPFALFLAGCFLATTGALLYGQAATSFSGPILGFVPGPSPNELLTIRGIPGAARISNSIFLPAAVSRIYLAPKQGYAVAQQGETGAISLVVLRSANGLVDTPVALPLSGAMSHPDLVTFSPNGTAAGLYSEATGNVQLFAGLPDSPRLVQQVSNISLAGGARAMAISDDAALLLMADGSGTVWIARSQTAPQPAYHASQVSALAFVPQSHDAIVCDPALDSITILPDGSSAGVRTLQPPSNQECRPSAAALTSDGRTILIACPAQQRVWSVDRTTGASNSYSSKVGITAFDRVGAAESFLASPADSNGTYWLVTWNEGEPAFTFIGAARGN